MCALVSLLKLLLLLLLLSLHQEQVRAGQTWSLNHAFTFNPDDPSPSIPIAFLDHYSEASAFLAVSGTRSNVSSSSTSSIAPYLSFVSFDNNQSFFLCIYIIVYELTNFGAIIWTANPDSPFPGLNANLSLQADGDLRLYSGNGTLIWNTNTSNRGVQGMELTAESPARLVLNDGNNKPVWTSTDFPTDTLTVGQVLEPANKLVSWSNATNPANGIYSLVMEPGGLALYDTSFPEPQPYWIWGFFGLNNSVSVMHTCNYSMQVEVTKYGALVLSHSGFASNDSTQCSNENPLENTKTLPFNDYHLADNVDYFESLFLRLGSDGKLQAYTLITSQWTSQFDLFLENTCFLPAVCGPYSFCSSGQSYQCSCPLNSSIFVPVSSSGDPALGCRPISPFNCSNDPSDAVMIKVPGVDYFTTKYTTPLSISTEQGCEESCEQNCSCRAAFWHPLGKACFHVLDQIGSLQQQAGDGAPNIVAYLKVGNSKSENNPSPTKAPASRSHHKIAVAATTSVLAALLVLACFTFCICRSFRSSLEEEDPFLDVIPGLPTRFSYKELQAITNAFTKKLGKGGFGVVYEGLLSDGTKVAVKQLEGMRQGDKEFRSEVGIMGAIHHFNVLRLLGFCAEGKHRLLVYEYMEKGSLDEWLFSDPDVKLPLSWELRYKIALGAARGLAYLHDDCREKIIHLDVKPQNVLLDADFVPKVADMGLSRLVGRAESPQVVTTMRGTPGYLAPEWLKEGMIDEKCDVFSFGMLLMEIISGRKNLNKIGNYYPEWAYGKVREGNDHNLIELTNAQVETKEEFQQLKQMINTAFLCVVDNPATRPSMEQVVHMLEGRLSVSDAQVSQLSRGLLFVLGNGYNSSCTTFTSTSSSISSKASTSTSSTTKDMIRGRRSNSYKHSKSSASHIQEMSLSVSGR